MIIKRPLVTEKSTIYKDKENVYAFEVDKKASKTQIKNAVEGMFNVSVRDVRTVIIPGKYRRMGQHGGYRSDWKKAYVKLKEGQLIKLGEQ